MGANNTINVHSTTGYTIIKGAQGLKAPAGSDTFNISSDAPLDTGVFFDASLTIDNSMFGNQFPISKLPITLPLELGLLGEIDIHAGPGINTLVASEAGAMYGDQVNLTLDHISGVLPSGSSSPTYQINYDATGSWGTISLDTGSAADTVDVLSTLSGVLYSVYSGGGGDIINVGDAFNTLDSLEGKLNIDGADSTATVNVNDQGNAAIGTYVVTANELVRDGVPEFAYELIQTLNLNTSNTGSATKVTGTAGATEVVITAGTGHNIVVVGDPMNTLDGL